MKVTSIKAQVKQAARYSIFVDGKYEFSLSDTALLDSKLTNGQELSQEQLREFKQVSADDKLYDNTLGFLAIRQRTTWEIETYLRRKGASPTLIKTILNKLSNSKLLDDRKFAEAFVSDRRLLRSPSRRKLIQELRQKHVADEIIQTAVGNETEDERTALRAVIERKRRQGKYGDDLKLMRYLAGQGFNYGDIKAVLGEDPPA
jgi:regulatory protein